MRLNTTTARPALPNYRHRSVDVTRARATRPDPKGGIARDHRLDHNATWRLH